LITDFLDDAPAREALVTLAAGGRDTVLVHVVAPEDESCSLDGARRPVDAETGEELVLHFDRRAREGYARPFKDWARALEAAARTRSASPAPSGSRRARASTSTSRWTAPTRR